MKSFFLAFIFYIFSACCCSLSGQNVNLKVKGETIIATSVINSLNYNSKFKDYLTLENEVNNLKNKLINKGYFNTLLKGLEKQNDSSYLAKFYVGTKTSKIKIYLPDNFNKNLLDIVEVLQSKTYFTVDSEKLEQTLELLNKTIAKEGNPFSTLKIDDISRENDSTIVGKLIIKKKKKRKIDNIVIKGYENFPKSYLKHVLKLKTKQVFNLEDIKLKTRALESIRFAKETKNPEVLFTNDSTSLYIYVEKSKSNTFDGFLGFGSNENTGKIDFDGYIDLRLNNNLNFGESLNLFYKRDEIDQQTFSVTIDTPYLFSLPIGLEVGLNIFRKDSTFSTTTQLAKLNYRINAKHKIGFGVKSTISSDLLNLSESSINDYNSSFFELSYNYFKPQYLDPLFPINFWINTSANFGNRTQESENTSQNIFGFEIYKLLNLNKRNSIYLRTNGAYLVSNTYLNNELFRFGGINSIRGFEENSLVANLYGVFNTEYRYKLNNSAYIHTVFDGAYLENKLTDTKNKLLGFGFGFGLLTKAGLFKLNYSNGKTENIPFKLSDSKVHVSLSTQF